MLQYRKATLDDLMLYFDWANDEAVRKNSYQSNPISLENHTRWFTKKIHATETLMLLFENELNQKIGQVRFETEEKHAVIGISTDANQRGKGYAVKMLQMACTEYLTLHPSNRIYAYIKKDNLASYKAFIAAGFQLVEEVIEEGIASFKLIK